MWRIAHVNDVEIEEIQRANPQLDIEHLQVGRRIFLPSVAHVKPVPKMPLNTDQWDPEPAKVSKIEPPKSKTVDKPKSKPLSVNADSFSWPYRGKVISTFGKRNLKMHNGIDIQIPKSESIVASSRGKVVYVGDQIEGYDRVVILLHDNHLFSIYAYVDDFLVSKDRYVEKGTPVARPRGDFFHFEIRHVKTALDPQKILK